MIVEFVWDISKIEHIAYHRVTPYEVEEVAFDDEPEFRKTKDRGMLMYDYTLGGRYLLSVFVFREKGKAWVITSRDMTKKEKAYYKGE